MPSDPPDTFVLLPYPKKPKKKIGRPKKEPTPAIKERLVKCIGPCRTSHTFWCVSSTGYGVCDAGKAMQRRVSPAAWYPMANHAPDA